MSGKRVTILGATGSIGQSALDVIAQANLAATNGPDFVVVGLCAHSSVDILVAQAKDFRPEYVALEDETRLDALKAGLSGVLSHQGTKIEIISGAGAASQLAQIDVAITVAAIVGAAGLGPTMNALAHGKIVALANKECLISAGRLFLDRAKTFGTTILPLDSEHNAIFQVLDKSAPISKLILTASGGPFRCMPLEIMALATPEQALAHPNWRMGPKISIDSATMMNKGLELIEAALLFEMDEKQIEVVVHPQSVIHSMVEYADGSILAQLGTPDMRIPISFALAWPKRIPLNVPRLNFADIMRLDFEKPDDLRFPLLALARKTLSGPPGLATVMNAANEVAVETFLMRKVTFAQIAAITCQCVEKAAGSNLGLNPNGLDEVMLLDEMARVWARQVAQQRLSA